MNEPGSQSSPASEPFSLQVRVYYENTDAGGVVYHAEYLRFFERARTEWLRELGISQGALKSEANILFTVRSMSIEYLSPARLDDQLEVCVCVDQVRRASMLMSQTMRRVSRNQLLATATVRVAVLGADTFRPAAAPETVWTRIRACVNSAATGQ